MWVPPWHDLDHLIIATRRGVFETYRIWNLGLERTAIAPRRPVTPLAIHTLGMSTELVSQMNRESWQADLTEMMSEGSVRETIR